VDFHCGVVALALTDPSVDLRSNGLAHVSIQDDTQLIGPLRSFTAIRLPLVEAVGDGGLVLQPTKCKAWAPACDGRSTSEFWGLCGQSWLLSTLFYAVVGRSWASLGASVSGLGLLLGPVCDLGRLLGLHRQSWAALGASACGPGVLLEPIGDLGSL